MPSPQRGQEPFREWSVCSSAQRRCAVRRPIPSAPRAHGAWGGTRAAAGTAISPAASAIAARRARHLVLRASIRASARTTSNPKSLICAGTETPVVKELGDAGSGISVIVIPGRRRNHESARRPLPGFPASCKTRTVRGIVRVPEAKRNWTPVPAKPERRSPCAARRHRQVRH